MSLCLFFTTMYYLSYKVHFSIRIPTSMQRVNSNIFALQRHEAAGAANAPYCLTPSNRLLYISDKRPIKKFKRNLKSRLDMALVKRISYLNYQILRLLLISVNT